MHKFLSNSITSSSEKTDSKVSSTLVKKNTTKKKKIRERKKHKTKMRGEDPQTKVVYELWSMIVHLFRSPPLSITYPPPSSSSPSTSRRRPQISTAAFGLLFIGISMALMLFGIVTFLIGFVLMPLVIVLVMLFYFVGIVSKLSEIGHNILWPNTDYYKIAPVWNY